jgi:hypothetical protein
MEFCAWPHSTPGYELTQLQPDLEHPEKDQNMSPDNASDINITNACLCLEQAGSL